MPFMGRDWRSPGEAWVKTESLGWQRMKIIESQLHLSASPACRQSLPACSWPPRAQLGQHMAHHCAAKGCQPPLRQQQQRHTCNMNCDQTDDPAADRSAYRQRTTNSVDDDQTSSGGSGSSSPTSARSSASSSPTSSPEKSHTTASHPAASPHRHLHHRPITISSPYGRYSATTCCNRHLHLAAAAAAASTTCGGGGRMSLSPGACNRTVCDHAAHHETYHGRHPSGNRNSHTASHQKLPVQTGEAKGTETGAAEVDRRQLPRSPPMIGPWRGDLADQQQQQHLPTISDAATRETTAKNGNCHTVQQRNDDEAGDQCCVRANLCDPFQAHNGSDTSPASSPSPPAAAVESPTSSGDDEGRPASGGGARDNPSSGYQSASPEEDRRLGGSRDNGELSSPYRGGGCCCCCCVDSFETTGNCCPHHVTEPISSLQQQQAASNTNTTATTTARATTPPHCRISVRTREVAMHNTISEAFYRLDFYNAIHDIRRFNYICKLLHLLITQNLTSLSGCATRVLFTMLEQVAWEVSTNKRNINVIRNLLAELKQTIQKYYCWGRPIGSSLLWQQHFETIERISQIVDEIELSPPPPKSDNALQVTFERLPVEMIREILLRLNDYRDLVSSAQASPVMRAMIDNQCIWQKMCRYHFTDQQLKLAFESNKFNYVKKQQLMAGGGGGGGRLRGVKYARTTSVDGRSSYRSPVSGSVAPTSEPTAVASHRRAPTRNGGDDEERRGASSTSSSSYVSNAVRIFDKERESSLRSAARDQRAPPAPNVATAGGVAGGANEAGQPALEIDWERVFHQLRKRFDLKEEYADCLLLCRHCRCLFWKSFGHPCIKSDEPIKDVADNNDGLAEAAEAAAAATAPATGASGNNRDGNNGASDYDCDSCNRSNERRGTPSLPLGDGTGDASGRVSVALLSRSFDRRAAQSGSAQDGSAGAPTTSDNRENILERHDGGLGDESLAGNQSGASNQQRLDSAPARRCQAAAACSSSCPSPSPLDNLSAQLREHNVNRQRRQDWQERPLRQQQQQQQFQEQQSHNHRQRRQDARQDSGARLANQRNKAEELVPKHVTISPQAFLKFFSL